MSKRLVGLDFGRGIAILGVIASHSFQGRIAGWNANILMDLVKTIPIVLLVVIFVPVVAASMLGSFFFFITAVGVSISTIRIRSKGAGSIVQYVVMKMFFAFFLRIMEDSWKAILSYYPFKQHHIGVPQVKLNYDSHSLDVVGFFNWFVPIIVVAITSIPKIHLYTKLGILCVIAYILLFISEYVCTFTQNIANWLEKNEYYFFYYLVMKFADGQFSLSQYWAYGFLGAAYGILFCSTNDFKTYWKFTWIQSIPFILTGIPLIFFTDDFVGKLFSWFRPISFLFIVGGVQSILMMTCLQLNDNPNRPAEKRHSFIRNTTFLRRANTLSLTAFIAEVFFTEAIYVVFKTFFGPGSDFLQEKCLWSWVTAMLYMVVCCVLWCVLIRLWEKANFRFSAESQLGAIMGWLFQVPYNKINYAKNIYGPLNDVKAELEEKLAKQQQQQQQQQQQSEQQQQEEESKEQQPEQTEIEIVAISNANNSTV